MAHNLRLADFSDMDATPFAWPVAVYRDMQSPLVAGELDDLIEYPSIGEGIISAIPALDHYLPMIYAQGLQEEGVALGLRTKVSRTGPSRCGGVR
ncbi:MAG TPA: hypothetical protein PLO06_11565 [Methanoregulaceae archaeon]|nr:hypothetical protein [Methanoregulaceae archaeon]HPD76404.1 hypothetical protein [Methanoregulaceae archaeon]